MNYLTERFKEPSTWAAIAALIPVAMQVSAGGASPQMIGGIAAAVAAIFIREKGTSGS